MASKILREMEGVWSLMCEFKRAVVLTKGSAAEQANEQSEFTSCDRCTSADTFGSGTLSRQGRGALLKEISSYQQGRARPCKPMLEASTLQGSPAKGPDTTLPRWLVGNIHHLSVVPVMATIFPALFPPVLR